MGKVTTKIASEMKEWSAKGASVEAIAVKFNTTKPIVRDVLRGLLPKEDN